MTSAGIEANPSAQGWLFGRGTDLMIGCGLGYILSIPLLYFVSETTGTTRWPELAMLVMILFMNSPHYGATIMRVYEARESRRKYALFSVYITIALAFLSVASAVSLTKPVFFFLRDTFFEAGVPLSIKRMLMDTLFTAFML